MLTEKTKPICFVLMVIFAFTGLVTIVPYGHTQQTVTPLSVTQQGFAKIQELISNQTLDPEWAKSFSQVTVSVRNIKGFAEYVLQFSSNSGTPAVVRLFYNMNGQYSGSSLGT